MRLHASRREEHRVERLHLEPLDHPAPFGQGLPELQALVPRLQLVDLPPAWLGLVGRVDKGDAIDDRGLVPVSALAGRIRPEQCLAEPAVDAVADQQVALVPARGPRAAELTARRTTSATRSVGSRGSGATRCQSASTVKESVTAATEPTAKMLWYLQAQQRGMRSAEAARDCSECTGYSTRRTLSQRLQLPTQVDEFPISNIEQAHHV